MKIRLPLLCIAFMCMCLSTHLVAQTATTTQPRKSPQGIVMQKIGLTDVKVVYHRPAVKGRQLMGKLIPENQVWRAGANENTVIYFSDDVKIEGQQLAAGKYGLHMIPSATDWTIIFSNNHSSWGSYRYNQKEDALRVKVQTTANNSFTEHLTYGFEGLESEKANCVLSWGDLKVPFNISVDVHEVVLASLREELQTQAGWTWRGWHEASNYCLKNKVNQKEALQWAGQSVVMEPNAQNMLTKAKLIAQVKGKEDNADYVVKALSKDLEANNTNWKTYMGLAQYLMKEKQHMDKAMSWVDQSIAMNSNMTNLMAKATLFESMGKSAEAKQVKSSALSKGTNAELNQYGYQLMWKGKTDEALSIFEANVKKHPKDPNVWDSLGEGYFTVGKKDKAIESFRKSLSLNPPDNVRANSMKYLKQLGVDDLVIKP